MTTTSTTVAATHVKPVLNAFVDDDGKDIILIEQQPDGGVGQRRVRAEYTTYHRSQDIPSDLMRMLKRADQVSNVVQETPAWVRIGWNTEYERRQARHKFRDKGIGVYEGDVGPVRYFLTQTRTPIAKPRRCYVDIETDSRVSFANKEQMRILCWAVSDDTGPVAKGILSEDTDEAEAALLTKLWSVFERFDQICAWNGGDCDDKDEGFDFYVIAQRSIRCGLSMDTRRWLWLDQLVVWRRMNQAESGDEKESLRLEDISQHQLGEGKEVTPDWVVEKFGDKTLGALAWDLWAAGGKYRKLLVDYCVKDTELLRKLEKRKGFITLFQSVCEATGVFGNTWGLFPTGQMDGFCLRLGRDKDYRFNTKPYTKDDGSKGFEGAFVLAPRTVFSPPNKETGEGGWTNEQAKEWRKTHGMMNGILREVHVCDFASLYPSNIITWNLSEDVLVNEDAVIRRVAEMYKNGEPIPDGYCYSPGTGVVTHVDPHGILTIALRELLRLRKFYADEAKKFAPGTPGFVDAMAKSTAYKVVANSFYGVAGAKTSRFFNKNVARSTTQNGVWLIKNVMKEGEKRKIEAIAGDTDSSFVVGPTRQGFDTFVRWLNEKHLPKIIGATGAKDIRVKLEFEKSFDILVFSGKKRYCNPPEAPIWMADMSFKRLGDVVVGDEVVGWVSGEGKRRQLVRSRVVRVQRREAPIVKLTFASGRILRCTADHRWLSYPSRQNSAYVTPKIGRNLTHVIDVPRTLSPSEQSDAAWLGGIWDGEGSVNGGGRAQITICQSPGKNPEVCARIESVLASLGFDYHTWSQHHGKCNIYALRGSKQTKLNFATWCRPAKASRKLVPAILKSRFGTGDEIVAIEPDGFGEVISMTTTTGNYVAWGYASKNCGRYSHYKWKTTCNVCKKKDGKTPGAVDVRTLKCEDCGHQYDKMPTFIGKPEIKGLEYRRGDWSKLAREMQGQIIDMLVGGLHAIPEFDDLERPIMDIAIYEKVIERWRDRILNGHLRREEVRISKTIKDEGEYKKKDDGKTNLEPQRLVAKILEARGQSVTAGTKIDFVIVDASSSPMKVIPAEDYDGECDRFHLWDTLVYPPSQRLLEGAFPDHNWAAFADVRPPKSKAKKVNENQLGLFASSPPKPDASKRFDATLDELSVPTFTKKPLEIRIPEEKAANGGLERLKEVLKANPGARPVEIIISLRSGAEAVLALPPTMRVTTGSQLRKEVERVLGTA